MKQNLDLTVGFKRDAVFHAHHHALLGGSLFILIFPTCCDYDQSVLTILFFSHNVRMRPYTCVPKAFVCFQNANSFLQEKELRKY